MIDHFRGSYSFLSNSYRAALIWEGDMYMSAVAAFVAASRANRDDRRCLMGFAISPWEAARLATRLQQGDFRIRADFNAVKDDLMLSVLRAKFQHRDLAKQLLATGDEPIVNINYRHDNYFGVCKCASASPKERKYGVSNRCTGQGEDRLAKMLLQVRSELVLQPAGPVRLPVVAHDVAAVA